jgi:hypothetical protein
MKKIIEVSEKAGLDSLLGEKVLLLCANYFYAGTLAGVHRTHVRLEKASLVYETGEWNAPSYRDAQALPGPVHVRLGFIEAFMKGK